MLKSLFLAALFAITTAAGAQTANPRVELKTSAGVIVLELYPDKAPKTVANFVQYVKDGHYNGTVFHRVIGNFMIQGGGFEPGMKQKPTRAPVENEAKNGLRNDVGTIAMARTSDPNSATAQFFINVQNNDGLNYPSPDGHGYAVFGRVVEGMDVVNRIRGVQTGTRGMHRDVPVQDVVIESATVLAGK
jgi:peptidyl-prolyl cis-trans isomerase A (cyclophilin A)